MPLMHRSPDARKRIFINPETHTSVTSARLLHISSGLSSQFDCLPAFYSLILLFVCEKNSLRFDRGEQKKTDSVWIHEIVAASLRDI